MNQKFYDIAIVGGGHAGSEAAFISTQFNLSVALISSPDVDLASAPCNPSIGGVGKGQVVREIDSLGGLMGILADMSGIQYRTLNESKGYAVQSTRVQIDKEQYSKNAERILSQIENLNIIRSLVVKISRSGDLFQLELESGASVLARKIVVTTGTFLAGKLHAGEKIENGGRIFARESVSLQEMIFEKKLFSARFKTGTPARLFSDSIDYSKLEVQPSDSHTSNFSIRNPQFKRNSKQVDCYLTYTNKETLSIIRDNRERSPIFNGQIKGVGPRYCPSIEDKAFRYTEKHVHHVFIEPEGVNMDTVYPSGLSTSLPIEVQEQFLQTISGLENCKVKYHGYAVEYDVVDTSMLDSTLQSKDIAGLYFAGQVCGTSGYEEAAGQGLVAGINASLAILGRERFILDRNSSYIGVMVEDLVTSKRDEPYRLFTARSENRLYLREDNTFLRMYPYRQSLLLNNEIDRIHSKLQSEYEVLIRCVRGHTFYTCDSDRKYFEEKAYGPLEANITLYELIKRPNLNPVEVLSFELERLGLGFDPLVVRTVAIGSKYEGYVQRMTAENEKISKLNSKRVDVRALLESNNISFECKLRIERFRPETFGQLRKIEGVRPATLAFVAGNLI